jgi:hypothetical protein
MVVSIKYFTFLLIYLGNSISVYIRQQHILKFLLKVEEESAMIQLYHPRIEDAKKQSLSTQNYAEYLFRSPSRSNKNNQF